LAPLPEAEELLRFSSLERLLRVTAWCRRWLAAKKRPTHVGTATKPNTLGDILTAAEVEEARAVWIRSVQATHYSRELMSLKQNCLLGKTHSLTRLTPFVDSLNVMRVGGRLKHALLSYDERHPIILPSESHLTRLIIEACHRRSLHGGVQLTLRLARQHYWIPRGRALVKRIIQQCVTCVRWRAAIPQQLMGNLPPERVTPARPFLRTGIDYAGPIQLRTSKGRGQRSHKAFIAVFVCLATRAVHLEVVSDYTADAFLAALRRFTARRGLCETLWSDCGTNFVGADAQLRGLFSASGKAHRQIANQLTGYNGASILRRRPTSGASGKPQSSL
jgi:hypothetical protein